MTNHEPGNGVRLIILFQKISGTLRLLAKKGFFQSHLMPVSIPLSETGARKFRLVDHSLR